MPLGAGAPPAVRIPASWSGDRRPPLWYPALKRAGIRVRKPYQTRHSFATLALSAGEAIGWVAKQMGHTSTKMVIEHYYRFIPNLTRHDGSAFDKAAAQVGL